MIIIVQSSTVKTKKYYSSEDQSITMARFFLAKHKQLTVLTSMKYLKAARIKYWNNLVPDRYLAAFFLWLDQVSACLSRAGVFSVAVNSRI